MPSGGPAPVAAHAFPRDARLRLSADFRLVQRSGRRVVTDDLVGLYLRDESSPGRFGLTVSRKVGNAVVRNRVKRWLRESIRRQRHGLTGVDVVLIARRSAAAAGYASLSEQVGRVLTRVRGAA